MLPARVFAGISGDAKSNRPNSFAGSQRFVSMCDFSPRASDFQALATFLSRNHHLLFEIRRIVQET
jgi:hypothetical protein